jgi:diadenosine tetraphosphate (Ap4A) HIT family hydrolase
MLISYSSIIKVDNDQEVLQINMVNIGKDFILWEDGSFLIETLFNPHQPYREGLHLLVKPKKEFENAWQNPKEASKAFELAARACKIILDIGLAPWFNIQANGNWGLLPGARPFFHIHIYARNKTKAWGKPLVLPEAPKTYNNEPMPEVHRQMLYKAFKEELSDANV